MCNLYSLTTSQAAIRELARAMRDLTGNLPPLPGIFPDYAAPIVRTAPEDGVRELAMARTRPGLILPEATQAGDRCNICGRPRQGKGKLQECGDA